MTGLLKLKHERDKRDYALLCFREVVRSLQTVDNYIVVVEQYP